MTNIPQNVTYSPKTFNLQHGIIGEMSQTKTNAQIAFGKAIKELRDKSELSQEDLALDAKMDRTYISGIERGVRNVSLLNIVRIAKALHLKVSELFLKAGL